MFCLLVIWSGAVLVAVPVDWCLFAWPCLTLPTLPLPSPPFLYLPHPSLIFPGRSLPLPTFCLLRSFLFSAGFSPYPLPCLCVISFFAATFSAVTLRLATKDLILFKGTGLTDIGSGFLVFDFFSFF